MTKQCKSCGRYLPADTDFFYKTHRGNGNLRGKCKECVSLESRARYLENKDRHLSVGNSWRENNRERKKDRERENYQRKAEKKRKKAREWSRNNKGYIAHKRRSRHALKIMATPKWANREIIRATYEIADMFKNLYGEDLHVDHIVPLKGYDPEKRCNVVCGLHWEGNLQVVSSSQNLSKGNIFRSGDIERESFVMSPIQASPDFYHKEEDQ